MNVPLLSPQAPPLGSRAILRQRWSDVTFLHWRVDPGMVETLMPAGCRPDVIDGSTWVGLIAFQMSKSSFFGGPSIPWLGDFPEVNVRLYSIDERGITPRAGADRSGSFWAELSVGFDETGPARWESGLPHQAAR